MAWTAPRTWVLNETLTATLLNAQIRDNMLMQAPNLARYRRGYFVTTTTANTIKYRRTFAHQINVTGERAGGTYGDLSTGDSDTDVGPRVECETGTTALVIFGCRLKQTEADGGTVWSSYASVAVSGATTISANDDWSIRWRSDQNSLKQVSQFQLFTTLTAGTNIFTMKYRAGNTGNTISHEFHRRKLTVLPLS